MYHVWYSNKIAFTFLVCTSIKKEPSYAIGMDVILFPFVSQISFILVVFVTSHPQSKYCILSQHNISKID